MYEFNTEIEIFGEARPCIVEWDPLDDLVIVRNVHIALIVEHRWNHRGELKPRQERIEMEIKVILSEDQIFELVERIRAACAKARADDYHDSAMQDWEEKNRRLLRAA